MRTTFVRAAVAAVSLACALPASAGFVEIGGGWAAQWDDSLDPFVNIESLEVTEDAVFIRKIAEFTQGPQDPGGFPAIPIVFRQVQWPAVTNIVIEDEVITNSTGHDWTGFKMQLLEMGDAAFDPDASADFDASPFESRTYDLDDTRLFFGDGVVANGDTWTPGENGKGGGALWISVNPNEDPFTVFTLKETPVPGPGALSLLALCAAFRGRRRG